MIEEQPVNTVLATMYATDADSAISEYQLIDGNEDDNGSEFFEINNVTGEYKSVCEGGEQINFCWLNRKKMLQTASGAFYCFYVSFIKNNVQTGVH